MATNNRTPSSKPRYAKLPRRQVLSTLFTCFASATLLTATPTAHAQGADVDTAAIAMLPEALRKSGVLHVGLEINYTPWMYQVGSKAEGIDPSLIRAIAAKLGLIPEFAFVDFAAILPGVQSGRFDVGANFANTA
ncbi:MAG: transporter substrate-binding domain-containing protein, partial [Pirellulales bacterium]